MNKSYCIRTVVFSFDICLTHLLTAAHFQTEPSEFSEKMRRIQLRRQSDQHFIVRSRFLLCKVSLGVSFQNVVAHIVACFVILEVVRFNA